MQIGADQQVVLRKPALGRVRKKPGDDLLGGESGHRRCLGEALFGERRLVVDEVPVRAADEADIGLENEHTPARL